MITKPELGRAALLALVVLAITAPAHAQKGTLFQGYSQTAPRNAMNPIQRFLTDLDRTATATAATESESLEGTLARLAQDRRKSPQTHRQLLARQVFPPSRGKRTYTALPIDRSELSEAYRPAWETLLLLPPSPTAADHGYDHAVLALAAIGNPQSLVVAERAFEVLVRPEVVLDTWVRDREKALFKLFLLMPGQPSLDALTRSLPKAAAQREQYRSYLDPWDPREHLMQTLHNLLSAKLRQQWLDTIRAGMRRAGTNRELFTEMEGRLLQGKSLLP